MKTIWGLILIISFAVILFSGVSVVNNQILAENANLDSKSTDVIAVYDQQVGNLSTFADADNQLQPSFSSNTTNQVDAFFRESAENKNNMQKFLDGLEYVYDLPEILLLSVPFIDKDSQGYLFTFKLVIWFLISVIVFLVVYKGIRTGTVDNER